MIAIPIILGLVGIFLIFSARNIAEWNQKRGHDWGEYFAEKFDAKYDPPSPSSTTWITWVIRLLGLGAIFQAIYIAVTEL